MDAMEIGSCDELKTDVFAGTLLRHAPIDAESEIDPIIDLPISSF